MISTIRFCQKVSGIYGQCTERQLTHDRDIDPLLARHHKGMISHAGSVRLVKGENRISLRLAVPAARDMFRFASMKLTRV